jgi:hypothetical protein
MRTWFIIIFLLLTKLNILKQTVKTSATTAAAAVQKKGTRNEKSMKLKVEQ